ncbi:MAG: CAP domain-containing protein [Raineya sp.]|jgi:pathogenesis-related protein 1|nr:CAP domain-containing protein [Raineya sp.]
MKSTLNTRANFLFLGILIVIAFLSFNMKPQILQDDVEPANMKGMTARHNYWRKELGLPPFKWSNKLAITAQKWANNLKSKGCQMNHSTTKYGENLYWSMGKKRKPEESVDAWASEKQYFNFETLECNEDWSKCGHYTQMIWENTKTVGCAVAYCKDGSEVWVCNYEPAGNVVGQKPYKKK